MGEALSDYLGCELGKCGKSCIYNIALNHYSGRLGGIKRDGCYSICFLKRKRFYVERWKDEVLRVVVDERDDKRFYGLNSFRDFSLGVVGGVSDFREWVFSDGRVGGYLYNSFDSVGSFSLEAFLNSSWLKVLNKALYLFLKDGLYLLFDDANLGKVMRVRFTGRDVSIDFDFTDEDILVVYDFEMINKVWWEMVSKRKEGEMVSAFRCFSVLEGLYLFINSGHKKVRLFKDSSHFTDFCKFVDELEAEALLSDDFSKLSDLLLFFKLVNG